MTHGFDTLVRVSRQYTRLLSDPSRQKLELRRVAASDLAQVFALKGGLRGTWQRVITVYERVSIQMQQVEMHFNDFAMGTFFSLQQIKNWWVVVLT